MDSQSPDDAHFQATLIHLARLEQPAPLWWRLLLLLLILAPAAAAMLRPDVGIAVLLLLPVLLLHELGHRAAMRVLHFRDVRLFFLPFADAGLPPSTGPVPVLHRCLALLAGPLPGLFLAVALQMAFHPVAGSLTGAFVGWLVLFNGANLVPLGAFDSGRLLESMLVHHRRLLAGCSWLATLAGLLGTGWLLASSALFLAAALMLLAPALFYPLLRAGPIPKVVLPPGIEDLNDGQLRLLHGMVREDDPEATAFSMLQLHERITEATTSDRGWLLLASLHCLGVALAVTAAAMLAHDTTSAVRGRIDNLVTRFDAFQEKYDQASADRAELEGEWAALIDEWRLAPEPIQEKAISILLRRHPSDPRRSRDLVRLARELRIPMTLNPATPP